MSAADAWSPKVAAEKYRALVTEWARHFNVPVPTIRIREDGQCKAVYHYAHHPRGQRQRRLRRRITMPLAYCRRCKDRSLRDALIHEFAHHLDYAPGKGRVAYRPIHSGHGESFRTALVRVATVAYGDPRNYNWDSEYKRVTQWAVEQGLTP